MQARVIKGRRVKGFGVGAYYISHPYYSGWFSKLLSCRPFPGTLNIETDIDWRELAGLCEPIVVPEAEWEGKHLGAVYVWRARVETNQGSADVLVIRPLLSSHEPSVLEIVACERLSPLLKGDTIRVEILCRGGDDESRLNTSRGRG